VNHTLTTTVQRRGPDDGQAAPPGRAAEGAGPGIGSVSGSSGPDRRARLTLGVILVTQLMVVLDVSIVNVALPSMQTALDFSSSGLSWVLNAYTLTFGGLLLLGSRTGDLLGRRRTFLAGLALFTLASLLGGLATSGAALVAARAVQGAGAAFAAPATLAMLMSIFPEGRQRTRALGLYTAVSVGGAAIGLLAGGMLTEWLSWRWVMYVNVPIGVAVILASLVVVRETPRRRGSFDLPGAVTSTLGMSALVYGFVTAASDGWGDPTTILSFVAGAVLLAAFLGIESRAEQPTTPLVLFASRTRSGAYVARLLMFGGMVAMFFFLTQFMQDVLGYSALQTGLGFLPVTVALFTASQVSARVLVDRFGHKPVTVTGALLSTASMLWLSQLSAASGYLDVLGPLVLLGLGNGIAFVPLTAMGLSGVAPEHAGAASGLTNVAQQLGGSLGLAALVTVFGRASDAARPAGEPGGAAAVVHGFVAGADAAFLAAAVLLAATVAVAAVVIRREPGRPVAVSR
jgi:EmrB/QacA subfamily drug resistance transporter